MKVNKYIGSLNVTNNHFYFDDVLCLPSKNDKVRAEHIKDTIYHMLGLYSLFSNYFVTRTAPFLYIERKIGKRPHFTLRELISNSELLPSPSEEDEPPPILPFGQRAKKVNIHSSLVESLAITAKRLNAYTLSTYAQTRILWTSNISRHMLLSQFEGHHYIELFALPCTLEGRSEAQLQKIGLSSALLYEIRDSYAIMLNPVEQNLPHQFAFPNRPALYHARMQWICPCISCSSWRLLYREMRSLRTPGSLRVLPWDCATLGYDAKLEELAAKKPMAWSQSHFRNLWPRIMVLDAHLRESRPRSLWFLFRDRRDTLQFWTFL